MLESQLSILVREVTLLTVDNIIDISYLPDPDHAYLVFGAETFVRLSNVASYWNDNTHVTHRAINQNNIDALNMLMDCSGGKITGTDMLSAL